MVIDGSKLVYICIFIYNYFIIIVQNTFTDSKIDAVDILLASQDGKIVRHDRLSHCKHGSRQKCSNCLPIDVY